jgi:hypothetical protein
MASLEKIQKNLSDIERKLTKAAKIASKGPDIKLGDAIKLGSKNNAIVSTIKKGIKEYSVRRPTQSRYGSINACRVSIPTKRRPKPSCRRCTPS